MADAVMTGLWWLGWEWLAGAGPGAICMQLQRHGLLGPPAAHHHVPRLPNAVCPVHALVVCKVAWLWGGVGGRIEEQSLPTTWHRWEQA